jgi:uncharacterized repeat protein (TIGR02543 family)
MGHFKKSSYGIVLLIFACLLFAFISYAQPAQTNIVHAQIQVTVTFSTSGGGTQSTVSPSGTVTGPASKIPVNASAGPGYSFSSWTATGSITFDNNTAPITMATISSSGTVTAVFTQNKYSVSFASSGGGSSTTSPTGTQSYTLGQVVAISVTAAPGYTFSSWSATGGTTFDSATSASTNAHIGGAGIITATFTQNVYSVGVTVSPSSAAGSVSGYVSTSTYHYGDVVTLTEVPSTGYAFSSWGGDGSGSATTCQVTVTKNMAVTATFTKSAYSLSVTVLPSGGGSVTANPSAPYHYGDVVTLTEVPSNGYTFSGWSGNGTGSGTTRSVTITGNMIVTATFTQINYQVTYAIAGGGSGSSIIPSGSQNYTAGSAVPISATAGSGYSFSYWTATGSIVFANASSASTQATINSAGTITATFVGVTQSPIPTASSNPSEPSPTPSPTPTPNPSTSPNPTSTPSPTPIPSSVTIAASTNNGSNVNIILQGDITSSTISSATLTTDPSSATTTLSLAITAQSLTNGFENVSIPKTAIPYGVAPTIYVNNEIAQNQGYTHDSNNYYVWFSTSYSTYELSIAFETKSVPPSFPIWDTMVVMIAVLVSILALFFKRNLKTKGFKIPKLRFTRRRHYQFRVNNYLLNLRSIFNLL